MLYMIAALPSHRTLVRLTDILQSSPISIDLTGIYIPLWYGEDTASQVRNFESQGPYDTQLLGFDLKYHLGRGHPELVSLVESDALRQRSMDLGSPADFPLRLVYLDYAPPLSRTNKSFIASVSNTLAVREPEAFNFEKDFLFKM